jgi:cell division protein FtsW
MTSIRNRTRKKSHTKTDITLLIVSALILVFGLIMLFSASVAVGLERFGDSNFFIKRQLLWLVIGLVAGYMCYKIDYHFWQKWSLVLLLASIILLGLVLVPGLGSTGQGAQRWLSIGSFSIQPSEFLKLTLILYMAAWLSERGDRAIKDMYTGLIPFAILIVLIAGLILNQPDLGTFIIIATIAVSMYFIGGARLKHIGILIITGLVGLGIAIQAAPYRLARLIAFVNPAADPQGAGYHIKQALIAVGSGGIFGVGLGHSRQKFFYLPEVTGDSLFAVIAEELGFLFSTLVIVLFLMFLWRGLRIAKYSPDLFGKFVSIGIIVWIVVQAFVNIGAMLGVLPLTGVTLPLMSYGGSSLIVTLAAIGILLSVSKQCRTR